MGAGRARFTVDRGRRRARVAVFGSLIALLACALGLSTAAAATTWTIVPSPNVTTTHANRLDGVSCLSSSFCFAVGNYETNTPAGGHGDPFVTLNLVEKWNGSAWSIVPSPNPVSNGNVNLAGVSCTGTGFCVAVGNYVSKAPEREHPLAERWNGTAWSLVSAPDSPKHSSTGLSGVSCVDTAFCMAVGSSGPAPGTLGPVSTVAERWNGSAWGLLTTPDPSPIQAELSDVSCTSSGFCFAVGNQAATFGGTSQTLSERWSGSAWTVVPSPDPTTTHPDFLGNVSCTGSSTFCMASGTYSTGSEVLPLMARWNGSAWSEVAAASRPGSTQNAPAGITCLGQTFCATAGFTNPSPASTLVEQWQGSTWAISPSQNTGGGHPDAFASVSCASLSFCAAVGTSGPVPPANGPTDTLIELGPAGTVSGPGGPGVPNTGAAPALGLLLLPTGAVLACAAVVGHRRDPARGGST